MGVSIETLVLTGVDIVPALLLLLICLTAFPVAADDASHRASAERFLKLANAERMTQPVYDEVSRALHGHFAQAGGSMRQEKLLRSYQQRARAEVDKHLAWPVIKDELVDVYLPLFSEAEFNALSEFYESGVGRKLLENLPQLTEGSMEVVRSRTRDLISPQIDAMLVEMAGELEPRQGGLR